jgi:hypothetical protein
MFQIDCHIKWLAFIRKLVVILVPEEMTKHPSPGTKRGKVKLEVYGKEMVVA